MRPCLFLSLALGILGSALQAAPWPEALNRPVVPVEAEAETPETITAPPKKVEPSIYDHLPSEKVCQENYYLAGRWKEAAYTEAEALGYYGWVQSESHYAKSWLGGGWHAQAYKAEIEECQHLEAAWFAAWTVRWESWGKPAEKWDGKTRCEYADELVSLIGAENFIRGQLPPPIPVWRVPRR